MAAKGRTCFFCVDHAEYTHCLPAFVDFSDYVCNLRPFRLGRNRRLPPPRQQCAFPFGLYLCRRGPCGYPFRLIYGDLFE